METKHNGWANYATWRIALEYGFTDNIELWDDYEGPYELANALKDYVEESLEMECENETTLSYALAFVENVDFYEIAESVIDCRE